MNRKWTKYLNEGELSDVGIVVCLNDEQQFLIIRRSDIDHREGQWTIPGGHIDDKDNSIEAGAVRELEEDNSEIPIYLLEKALEISKNEINS
jgi:8-oxo-dGTP pyrophosphatase MutT (NUDIX family)